MWEIRCDFIKAPTSITEVPAKLLAHRRTIDLSYQSWPKLALPKCVLIYGILNCEVNFPPKPLAALLQWVRSSQVLIGTRCSDQVWHAKITHLSQVKLLPFSMANFTLKIKVLDVVPNTFKKNSMRRWPERSPMAVLPPVSHWIHYQPKVDIQHFTCINFLSWLTKQVSLKSNCKVSVQLLFKLSVPHMRGTCTGHKPLSWSGRNLWGPLFTLQPRWSSELLIDNLFLCSRFLWADTANFLFNSESQTSTATKLLSIDVNITSQRARMMK